VRRRRLVAIVDSDFATHFVFGTQLYLFVAIGAPRLLVEAVVEVVRDRDARPPPGLLFERVNVQLEHRRRRRIIDRHLRPLDRTCGLCSRRVLRAGSLRRLRGGRVRLIGRSRHAQIQREMLRIATQHHLRLTRDGTCGAVSGRIQNQLHVVVVIVVVAEQQIRSLSSNVGAIRIVCICTAR
jgi:hypothetical protein